MYPKNRFRSVGFMSVTYCLLIFCQLFPQSANKNFVHFTQEQGLPSSQIHRLLQDHQGYIWIGSISGLARYDGYEFTQFVKNVEDTNSIQTELVSSLYEDKKGDIWIGSVSGLSRFNRANGTFDYFNLSQIQIKYPDQLLRIEAISEDAEGRIIIGLNTIHWGEIGDGLAYLDPIKGEIRSFKMDSIPDMKNVLTTLLDSKGTFWFGGYAGLYTLAKNGPTWRLHELESAEEQPAIISLKEDLQGIIWLGSHRYGLYRLDPSDGSISNYLRGHLDDLYNNNFTIWDLDVDSSNKLWLATDRGLIYFDPETGEQETFLPDGENENSLKSDQLSAVMIDFSGSVWIGSWNGGMSRYDPERSYFRSFKHKLNDPTALSEGWASSLFEDNNGDIWVGTVSLVLNRFDRQNKNFLKFPSDNIGLESPRISTAFQDRQNTIWIGTWGEKPLFRFSPDNKYLVPVDEFVPPVETTINVFYEVDDGTLWIGTNNGLFHFRPGTGIKTHIKFDSLAGGTSTSNQVHQIVGEQQGNLWIGTDDGLFKLNVQTLKIERLGVDLSKSKTLKDEDINSLYADRSGKIWIGTWQGGLNRYDPDLDSLTTYTIKDGLVSNSIQGILGDEENNALWLSTFEGLSRFDLQSKQFVNYGVNDGIQGKQFADGSALKTSLGEFVFGGVDGITIFTSDEVKKNMVPPRVLITDLKLFNKSLKVDPEGPLSKPLYLADEIVLNHNQNDIAFNFIALHFANSNKNQYAYKLENYQDGWRNVGTQRSAIFPNLPPGNYTFRLKASNSSGVWDEEGASIELTILPPWWRTIWAYIGYVFIFIGLVFSIDRIQRKRLIAKERNAAAIKEAELRAQVAEAENARKSKELEEARQLQLSMLPKEIPQLPNLDIAVYMKTATEVGGDYYDFHVAMDGTLTAVIGDATGHGMKAGTMVTSAKSLFNVLAPNTNIIETFHEMTRCLKLMKLEKLSMCMTMLKIAGNKLQMSAAGMPPSYIFRGDTGIVEEHLLEGMPLGTMDNFQYKIQDTTLSPGDTILLLTDGLPELQDENGDMFGYKRVRTLFEQVAEQEPEEIINQLKNDGSAWVNDQDPKDDVTFVVIKVK